MATRSYLILILIFGLLLSKVEAAKTKKAYHLAWDANVGAVSFYTVYQYRPLTDDYFGVGTVLFPAPPLWPIPIGTLKGTIYSVSATDNDGFESLRSKDFVLVTLPK